MAKPLCIDLFCGLGGWAEGFLSEGYDVIGFDIERHDYGTGGYPGQLVLQDVLTLDGRQFRNAAVIVASPPCQGYSYMAMPWGRAKQIARALRGKDQFPEGYMGSRTVEELRALFDGCFRISREAGVSLVVENVKGAQPWVGNARARFGSFYFWGDIGSVGGGVVGPVPKFGEIIRAQRKTQKRNPDGTDHGQGSWFKIADSKERGAQKTPEGNCAAPLWKDREIARYAHPTPQEYEKHGFEDGRKVPMNLHEHEKTGKPGRSFQSVAVAEVGGKGFSTGLELGHDWRQDPSGRFNSKSNSRKAASAQIAKIPFPLAQHIARVFKP